MSESFPFQSCNEDDLKAVLSVKNRSIKTHQEIMTTRKILAQKLPFSNSSDYAMLTACLSDNDKLLDFFENNTFTSECHNLIDEFSMENYSCKYYNENKFNSILSKHQDKSIKIFHLNFRSLNKHCHELNAFLSCLNCKFDVLLLTEIGNASKN